LDRRLGGPQNRSGRCEEEKHLAPAGNPTPAVQPMARRDATDTGVIRIPVVFQLHAPTVKPPEKEPLLLIGHEGGWAPEPVWTLCIIETSCRCLATGDILDYY
jgi:hypothetical protein